MSRSQYGWMAALWAAVALGAACGDPVTRPEALECGDLDPGYLADGGVGRDGIPALTNPDFVPIDDDELTGYLSEESRVIGVEIDGGWLAIPTMSCTGTRS